MIIRFEKSSYLVNEGDGIVNSSIIMDGGVLDRDLNVTFQTIAGTASAGKKVPSKGW